jgi:hypothetical protein
MKSACRIGLALLASALSFAPLTAFVVPHSATEIQQASPSLEIGQRVEAWINVEWMPATLIQIGDGPFADSPFLVEYGIRIGGRLPVRWLKPNQIRPLSKPEPPPVPIPPFRVGDEVDVWINVEWMPGRIVQVGGGPYEDSPFRVAYGIPIGGIQPTRWVIPERVRPVATGQPVGQTTGPRPGRYQMLSYGNPANPIRIGHIMLLAGDTYEFYTAANRLIGSGRYAFNPSEQEVVWHDGPLHDQGWGGTFTIERDGKTHKIELKRGTIATNSID